MHLYFFFGGGGRNNIPHHPIEFNCCGKISQKPRYHGMVTGDVVSYSCVVSAMARMAQWQQASAVLMDLGKNDADEVAWYGGEG